MNSTDTDFFRIVQDLFDPAFLAGATALLIQNDPEA